jgi:hypothetical protein
VYSWPFSTYLFPFLEKNTSVYAPERIEYLLRSRNDIEKLTKLIDCVLMSKSTPSQITISLERDYPSFYFAITSALIELGVDALITNWAYFNASRTKHLVLIYSLDNRILKGLRVILGQIDLLETSNKPPLAYINLRKYFEVKSYIREMPVKTDMRLSNLSLAKGLIRLNLWELSDFALMATFKYIKTSLAILTRYRSHKPSKLALDIMARFRTRSRSDTLRATGPL